MNDFYLTFPSNLSKTEYPHNTQSNYTTSLVETIELKGEYEVALAELNYLPLITTDLGNIILSSNFRTYYYSNVVNNSDIFIEVNITKNIDLEDLLENINKQIKIQMKIEDLKERAYLFYGRTSDLILKAASNHNEINKNSIKKYVQVFKDDVDPNYYFIDVPDSDHIRILENELDLKVSYDHEKMKWIFTSVDLKKMAKIYSITIYFVVSLINNNDFNKNILSDRQISTEN